MEVFDAEGKSIFDAEPKKKKKYVLYLFKLNQDVEIRIRTIEKAIQTALVDHILLRLEDPNEGLTTLLVKNVEIIFIDSSLFSDDKLSVEFAVECKKRKKCPVFFTAINEEILIKEYRKNLALYQEFDDYFIEPIDFIEISRKLKRASLNLGRKAKRFSLNIPIQMYRLNNDKIYNVTLNDLSLIGFGITLKTEDMLQSNEQVKIKIPLINFSLFHPHYGEFLPISGKIRRISINGKDLGVSIEYLTPMQIEVLMNLLEKITRRMRLLKIVEKPKEIKDEIPF